MKYLFVFLFLILGILSINAQHWNEISQESIHLKYDVPQGWYVGGVKSGKACQCTGASLNSAQDQSLNMVVFFSDKESIDSLQNQKVWGYSFVPPSMDSEKLPTTNFNFEKSISTWEEDKNIAVLRFATTHNNFNYVVYFWGSLNSISINTNIIEHILTSIQPL